MKEKVVAIFDIGKTNKKIIFFNYDLKPVWEFEEKFAEIKDDDGFACDDIEKIENWISEILENVVRSNEYDLAAVNFTTYGATLAYLDKYGQRLGPVYNYLKPIDEKIPERIFRKHGGQDEFCRRTASPALGMLNSGMQAAWLKYAKPDLYDKVSAILHFPQYLSYRLTRRIYSEHTSIGCHTALWDFDSMSYHAWTREEGFPLPLPSDINTINDVTVAGKKVKAGIGIHDSSSSLAPYFTASRGKFLLMSTGTWCINMNPFNTEILTTDQLDHDCLCYMSITKQPVKSSRLFLGHLHETAVKILAEHFRISNDSYKNVKPDKMLLEICKKKCGEKRFYFENMPYSRELKEKFDLFAFKTFEEGYHQLMVELAELTVESINLVIPAEDDTENIYITGGFSNNPLFLKLISEAYPSKKVYTSEIFNATALGAALVVLSSLDPERKPEPDLGLNLCQ
jgi:sugar (pentulose or hexulose) kinase